MRRKLELSLLLLILVGLLIIGNSLAYFSDDHPVAEAKFTVGTVEIDIQNSAKINAFSVCVDRKTVTWSITNTGSNSVYLRVKPLGKAGLEVIDGEIELRALGLWQPGNDGYYYYPHVISPGKSVNFSLEIIFNTWDSVDYSVDIRAEAVQASHNAITEIWPGSPFS